MRHHDVFHVRRSSCPPQRVRRMCHLREARPRSSPLQLFRIVCERVDCGWRQCSECEYRSPAVLVFASFSADVHRRHYLTREFRAHASDLIGRSGAVEVHRNRMRWVATGRGCGAGQNGVRQDRTSLRRATVSLGDKPHLKLNPACSQQVRDRIGDVIGRRIAVRPEHPHQTRLWPFCALRKLGVPDRAFNHIAHMRTHDGRLPSGQVLHFFA